VKRLDRVNQRGSVVLLKNIPAHLKHVIRAESQEVTIEGRVMQGAQRQPVADKGFSGWLSVRDYVRRIKELLVTQTAECTLTSVGFQDTLTEGSLVESNSDGGSDVHATGAIGVLVHLVPSNRWLQAHMRRVVDRDGERETGRIICNHKDGPRREILSGDDSMEIDQRETALHCQTEAPVVRMLWIRAAISIPEQSIRAEGIIVGACRRGGD